MMIRGDSGYGPSLPELHKRLRWVALVVLAAFALLVGRLWQLQVMRGESYYERTVSNVVKERYLPSVRGKIVDSKGVALADNRPAFNIYATPKQLTPAVKSELERMLGYSGGHRRVPVIVGASAPGFAPMRELTLSVRELTQGGRELTLNVRELTQGVRERGQRVREVAQRLRSRHARRPQLVKQPSRTMWI